MTTINMPVPFAGTDEESKANFLSHDWNIFAGLDGHCFNCDCKPWHVAARYKCGTEPPRQTMQNDS